MNNMNSENARLKENYLHLQRQYKRLQSSHKNLKAAYTMAVEELKDYKRQLNVLR